jgi:hypothetical protein
VTGKNVDGQNWTPFTTAEGLAAKQTGKGEFAAPQKAIDLIKAKDYGRWASPELGTLPVDFMSTVDITNGNSGSSTLNAKGEFVGLAFDGTLDGVIADWSYDPTINRTIHVDSRFMLWTMDKVDGAQRLLGEMGRQGVAPCGRYRRQFARGPAGQCREPQQGGGALGLQQRHLGPALIAQRGNAGGVEAGAKADLAAPFGQLQASGRAARRSARRPRCVRPPKRRRRKRGWCRPRPAPERRRCPPRQPPHRRVRPRSNG